MALTSSDNWRVRLSLGDAAMAWDGVAEGGVVVVVVVVVSALSDVEEEGGLGVRC